MNFKKSITFMVLKVLFILSFKDEIYDFLKIIILTRCQILKVQNVLHTYRQKFPS